MVTNALFRVESVSEKAPPPFEHIEHESGAFWIYELLGYDFLSISEWIDDAVPKLERIAPILADYPNSIRYLYIQTEIDYNTATTQNCRFSSILVKAANLCIATIEHSVVVNKQTRV